MSHTHLDGRLLTPARRVLLGLAPAVGGLCWLLTAYGLGGAWRAIAMTGAVASLGAAGIVLWQPLGRRAPQLVALAAAFDALLALSLLWPLSFVWWLLLVLSAFGTYLASGYLSLLRVRGETGIPLAEVHWRQAFKAAADEAVLGYFVGTVSPPRGERLLRIAREYREGLEWFERRGLLRNPAEYHAAPPKLTEFKLEARSAGPFRYDHLQWPSGYAPPAAEPGAERWLTYANTQTAHARIFRHAGVPRPWLICLHGYRMGWRWIDFRLFQPAWLHHALGLNLALPILPLHGERAVGWRSGDGFMDGDLMDIIHAEAQAQWDLRRLIRWLRETQNAQDIAVLGYSLGGYNAALLSTLEAELRCVIAAIPLVDIAGVLWTQGAPRMLQLLQAQGVTAPNVHKLLRVVSPLALPCRLPRERRHIIAATADRIVALPPVLELWRHWEEPTLDWFQGTHLSVRREAVVPPMLEAYLGAAGMLGMRTDAALPQAG